MTVSDLVHIPLDEAHVCLEADCGHIGNSRVHCPACNGKVVPLWTWIPLMNEQMRKDKA